MLSNEYRQQLIDMHTKEPWGTKGFKYIERTVNFIGDCKSVLDYGAGQRTLEIGLREIRPDLEIRSYDPGIPEISLDPLPADLVVCTDVLEHIEPDHLTVVLNHIFDLAHKRVYLHVALTKAKRFLPDGRNAHLIQQPTDWWINQIGKRGRLVRSDVGRKMSDLWYEK